MSLRHSCIAVALCPSLALSIPALANPTQDARKAVQTAYIGMDKATKLRSASAYTAYLHPDYVGIDEKGVETDGRPEMVKSLGQAFALVNTAASSTQVLTLTLQSGGAVVTQRSALTMSGTKNNQPFIIKIDSRVRDFWVKAGGRWLLKREHILSETKTINGRQLPS